MITKRVPPPVDDPTMARVVKDIYDTLNQLIEVVGKYEITPPKGESGRVGEVRITKMEDNTYRVNIKSGEGWVTSSSGTFEFQERI